ncbi:MAG: hypothetical protein IKZ82_12660 [Clostridia bacterium]|nr:hypothetical protein [Clostridia bacterium]
MYPENEKTDISSKLVEFRKKVDKINNINSLLRMALCSQMKSLLELKESGFFAIICNNSIEALDAVVDGAIKSQSRIDVSISRGLEEFVEALNVTLQSYLFTDSTMLEFLSANTEVYGVRNNLSLEYARFISDCISFLESDADHRTKYLFTPSLSSSVFVARIWNVEPQVCIIKIPTETMLTSPKKLLFRIAHEVSHYAGRSFRKCEERNKVIRELCTIIFVQYSVNYFNLQIGRSSVEETNRIKKERKERILNAIRHVRNGYSFEDMYSVFCKDLRVIFQNIIESVEFIEAFNLGLRNSSEIYDYSEEMTQRQKDFSLDSYMQDLRKNVLVIQDFFMQMIKECTADIISAKILGISDACEYIRIMSSDSFDSDHKENVGHCIHDILKDDTTGDFGVFSNLVRKLIVAGVISRKGCFTEEDKNTIFSFKLADNHWGLLRTTSDFFLGFIKHMIWTDSLDMLFDFLNKVNLQERLDGDNPCRDMFNSVRFTEHSDDYYESII